MTGQVSTQDIDEVARRVAEQAMNFLGVSSEAALILSKGWLRNTLTQYCDDCGAVIAEHPNARWRFNLHTIRCDECREKLIEAGYDSFEARYVM